MDKNKKHKEEHQIDEVEDHTSEDLNRSKEDKNTSEKSNNSCADKESPNDETGKKQKKGKKSSSGQKANGLTKKLEEKEQIIKELNEKFSLMNDKYLRLSAEFDNYRKRTLKEKIDLTHSAGHTVIKNLLPVVDDIERAMENIEKTDDLESVKKGMELIYIKFYNFLKQEGIEPIEAVGKEFDTDEHEAMTKIPAPKEELKGKVVEEIQKGYKANDQILRHSKVVVGE
jgi:molecular chaperone GrpE